MLKSTRTLITACLALILFGGIASPSAVYADSSSTHTTTTKASDSETTTLKISSVELPYTLFSNKNGINKVYMYPKAPAVLTADQINDDAYMAKLSEKTPALANLQNTFQAMVANGANYDLKQSYLDMIYPIYADEYSKKQLEESTAISPYLIAWLISRLAKIDLHRMTFEQAQTEYQNDVHPKFAKYPIMASRIQQYDKLFENEENYNSHWKYVYDTLVNSSFFTGYSKQELSTLDPDASYRQMIALINKPMSDFFKKQADGTYQIDGLLLNNLLAYSFWYEDKPTIPDPLPTPQTSQPVTVHYVDDQGQTLKPDKTLTGKLGESYKTTPLDIDGYALTQTAGEESGTFGSTAKSVTYTYSAVLTSGGAADTIAPEGTVIYATKKIGLYKNATFTNKARKQWYAKKSRINRPMFVVTGYAKSKNGAARYHVKDVNHHSKTAGKTGYVTANAKYTSRVYYATKQKTITVINPKGVNAYSKKNLTHKKAHYRQGQVLKVKKIVNQNLTTRFVLSNGRYVTANKLLVQAGKQTMPKRVQAKTALNRYDNVNLTKRNQHYTKKSHATFKVKGWDYSNANDFSKGDTLRYQVAGGYISGNQRFVTTFK
ncbi:MULTISPECIES: DUF5776 domain-containing protein [Lactobacillaceae]|uniref:DUF5776 domain-containing protein n=1 Tax=Lactobacillaceae TaxID=33958 RepID=UPI001456ACFD|nr:DUF5776 domain-containing protein [Lactobacillus sp. HBUAS51381]NLR10483.1 MucBP domain-containing protein [Lactobacillus sp. HBUAS51381]